MTRTDPDSFNSTIHVVVAGVNDGTGLGLANLAAPEREAEALARGLGEAGPRLPLERISTLVGADATKGAILKALGDAVSRAGATDSVIFYFSGHGLTDDNDFWLCASGARADALGETALSGSDLDDLFKDATLRGLLVILDCCQGGAFAERAPTIFRSLRSGDYRLLIASARANQRSWESSDGSGTLFSRALTAIVRGDIQVGTIPGAIYFSDLVQGIDAAVQEELASRPSHPLQEMLFVGSYARDPLLLVNRKLSLKQVQFATARYSPAHLRRIYQRSAIAITIAVFFVLTGAYGYLDAKQFAEVQGDRLAIVQGHPTFRLPGYPHTLYTLSFGPEGIANPNNAINFRIEAPIGKPVAPLLLDQLSLRAKVSVYLSGGWDRQGDVLLRRLIEPQQGWMNREWAAGLVSGRAKPSDRKLFERWLTDPDREVKRSGLGGLLRLDPDTGLRTISQFSPAETQMAKLDMIRTTRSACTATILQFVEAELFRPDASDYFQGAARIGCKLPVSTIMTRFGMPGVGTSAVVSGHSLFAGNAVDLAHAITDALQWERRPVQRGALLATLARLPGQSCSKTITSDLLAGHQFQQSGALQFVEAHCPELIASRDYDTEKDTIRYRLADGKAVELPQRSNDIADGFAELLNYMADKSNLRFKPLLLAVVDQTGNNLFARSLAAEALLPLAPHETDPKRLNAYDFRELRATFDNYRRASGDQTLLPELFSRLSIEGDPLARSDIEPAGTMGRLPLSASDLDKVKELLGSERSVAGKAACVLAMRSDTQEVVKILTGPDAWLRASAAQCSGFNPRVTEILRTLPRSVEGMPLDVRSMVDAQASEVAAYRGWLRSTPRSLWKWRIQNMQGPFGAVKNRMPGVGFWIDEQLFQIAIAKS